VTQICQRAIRLAISEIIEFLVINNSHLVYVHVDISFAIGRFETFLAVFCKQKHHIDRQTHWTTVAIRKKEGKKERKKKERMKERKKRMNE